MGTSPSHKTPLEVASSQNHTIIEVGRDVWRASSPAPNYLSNYSVFREKVNTYVLAQICGFRTVTRRGLVQNQGKWKPAFPWCPVLDPVRQHIWETWMWFFLIFFFSIWRGLDPCFAKVFLIKYAEEGKQMSYHSLLIFTQSRWRLGPGRKQAFPLQSFSDEGIPLKVGLTWLSVPAPTTEPFFVSLILITV